MTDQIRKKFIYNGEDYYLLGLEHRLKHPVEGLNSTAEGYVDFDEIIDFFSEDEELVVNVIEGKTLVTPHDYDMIPRATWTNCLRGFCSTYAVTDEGLFLKEMIIHDVFGNPKPIQGVQPIITNDGELRYQNLKVIIPLTGRITLILRKDLIDAATICDTEEAVKTLLKMTFEKGKLVAVKEALLILGNAIDRRMKFQKQSKGLIEGVKLIGLLPPTDSLSGVD